jgi:uncharacterized protein (DUF2236 family)
MSGHAELGTGSLLWRHLGDRRFLMVACRAMSLQMLHPAIVASRRDHARAPRRIWEHQKLTLPQIVQIAYSDRDHRSRILFAHDRIKGNDENGKRYHALDPDLFFYEHATYVDSLVTMIATFHGPPTPQELEQLYSETCSWYRLFGISDRAMPDTWSGFQAYFDAVCAEQLMVTVESTRARPQLLRPDLSWGRTVPAGAVRALQHPRAAELLRISVSSLDRLSLRGFVASVNIAMTGLNRYPPSIRRDIADHTAAARL